MEMKAVSLSSPIALVVSAVIATTYGRRCFQRLSSLQDHLLSNCKIQMTIEKPLEIIFGLRLCCIIGAARRKKVPQAWNCAFWCIIRTFISGKSRVVYYAEPQRSSLLVCHGMAFIGSALCSGALKRGRRNLKRWTLLSCMFTQISTRTLLYCWARPQQAGV